MARKNKQKPLWGNLEPGNLAKVEDIKILICIILFNTKQSLDSETITNIIRYDAIATYFDVAQALIELERDKHILPNENREYSLTENGKTIAKMLNYEIPFTVRERALESLERELTLKRRLSENKIDIVQDEDKYIVKISMLDNDKEMMGVSMRVASKDDAIKIKANFLNDPTSVYTLIFRKLYGINPEE